MATKPRSEQLRLASDKTGEHILDTYIENAEYGDRTLADLLSDLFDETGNLIADIELRVNGGYFEYRHGVYVDPEAGWQQISSFLRDRGTYSPGSSYEPLDMAKLANGLVVFVQTVASAPASPDPDVDPTMQWVIDTAFYDDTAAARDTAVQAKTDAEAAQTAAETAQTGAETAQSLSETAQAASESARDASQTAQAASESARDTSVTKAGEASASATAAATSESNAADSEAQALIYKNDAEAAASVASGSPVHKGSWDASGGTLPPTPASEDVIYVISVAGTLPTVGAVYEADQLWYTQGGGAWFSIRPSTNHVLKTGDTMTGNLSAPTFTEGGVTLSTKYLGIGAPAASVAWGNVTSKPATFSPSAHSHTIAEITGLQSALDGKSATTHNHDSDYLGISATAAAASKLATARTISLAGDVTGSVSFDGSANVSITATVGDDSHTHAWANITSKPSTFTPSAHTHLWADITDKPSTFTPSAHNHSASELTSGTVASARLSGTYSISISGNASTATNADTLDGINSSSFLRSNANDIKTSGYLRLNDSIKLELGNSADAAIFHSSSHSYWDYTTGNIYFRDNASTTRFEFHASGLFRADNDVVAYYSDERLKNIVGRPQHCLDDVMQWRVIEYYPTTYLELASGGSFDSTVQDLSLSAQSVQQNTPEAVAPAPFDLDEDGNSISGEDYLTLKDRPLIAKLVGAVQELTDRVKELEHQLENARA